MDEHGSFFASLTRGTHVLGVALIGLGILSALAPGFTAAPVVILIGLLVVLAGIVRSMFAWRAWSEGKSPLGLFTGGLAVACGLALVFNPVSTAGAVSSLVALYIGGGGRPAPRARHAAPVRVSPRSARGWAAERVRKRLNRAS